MIRIYEKWLQNMSWRKTWDEAGQDLKIPKLSRMQMDLENLESAHPYHLANDGAYTLQFAA